MLATGSKSFHAASLVLPRRVRDPATALYAFCRAADDAVDTGASPLEAVGDLRARLAAVYAGRPRAAAVDRAFAAVVAEHRLPQALPEALLEGFSWDAEGRTYRGIGDLEAYALRVAGTVGMMMSVLMGRRDGAALARAADLGIAMQYTNIARDVGEDARAGRLYLPQDWLRGEGIAAAAFLERPLPGPGVTRVVGRLLALADVHYVRAVGGIGLLPRDCRPAIHAARLVYRAIGSGILDGTTDPVAGRSTVSAARKITLVGAAFAASLLPTRVSAEPPPQAAAALVQAVAEAPPARPLGSAERMIDILAALEERRPARPRLAAR